jgi:hypothetical protein
MSLEQKVHWACYHISDFKLFYNYQTPNSRVGRPNLCFWEEMSVFAEDDLLRYQHQNQFKIRGDQNVYPSFIQSITCCYIGSCHFTHSLRTTDCSETTTYLSSRGNESVAYYYDRANTPAFASCGGFTAGIQRA